MYEHHRFCFHCGSRWVNYRLSPVTIVREFSDKYLGSDNVFLVTIFALFRYPEDVINGYIQGQRKRYVNPVNFYLISLTLIGLQFFVLKNFAPELLGYDQPGTDVVSKTFLNYMYDYFGLWTTFMLPAYFITGYLVFINLKIYNFSEHVIFYVYAFGLMNILTAFFTPVMMACSISFMNFSLPIALFSFIQIAWYYKRVFKLGFGKIVLKTLIAIPVYLIINLLYLLILCLIILGIVMLFFPDMSFPSIQIN